MKKDDNVQFRVIFELEHIPQDYSLYQNSLNIEFLVQEPC